MTKTINELTPQQIARIVQLLNDGTQSIDDATLLRLAQSRKQAVTALGNRTQTASTQLLTAEWKHRLVTFLYRDYRVWAPALLLLAILAGTFGPNLIRNNTTINTDSLVLASELPPEAFADKEFVAWLDHTSRL